MLRKTKTMEREDHSRMGKRMQSHTRVKNQGNVIVCPLGGGDADIVAERSIGAVDQVVFVVLIGLFRIE